MTLWFTSPIWFTSCLLALYKDLHQTIPLLAGIARIGTHHDPGHPRQQQELDPLPHEGHLEQADDTHLWVPEFTPEHQTLLALTQQQPYPDISQSCTGMLVYLNSALVYWSSKKQTSVESSSFAWL